MLFVLKQHIENDGLNGLKSIDVIFLEHIGRTYGGKTWDYHRMTWPNLEKNMFIVLEI